MSGQAPVRESFFSDKNEQMLDKLLYNDVQRRTGSSLDDRQKQRLVKTVKHYMSEVYRINGSTTTNVQFLNKEVLTAVVPDYMGYLRRQTEEETSSISAVEVINSTDPLRTDTGTRFALMQESRQEVKAKPPTPPDFRIPLEDESRSAIEIFEQVKKIREAEAARDAAALDTQQKMAATMPAPGQMRSMEAGPAPRPRILENEIPRETIPDMRAVLFGQGGQTNSVSPYRRELNGLNDANPTLVVPQARSTAPVLPQDFVQKQDDVINYKENEYNLHCYSADRDWTVNTGENRYNFSVNFNPGNVTTNNGIRPNTSTQIKFRNIVRIELVKALIPVEGVDTLIDRSGTSGFQTIINTNALSFPYLMVRIPELETNNFGTNFGIDRSFGLLQYDANWITDNTNVTQRGGFLGMIPKFLKCQKIYYPTPLSTLQKLSIQIQRPDGNLLSPTLDTLDISGFVLSNSIPSTGTPITLYHVNGASAGLSQYIWIQTTQWFSTFMFNQGDRIQLKNLVFTQAVVTGASAAAATDFVNYMTDPAGLLVVNIGYYNTTSSQFATGVNTVGYANYIIVEARYNDPTKGYTTVSPFAGIASNALAAVFYTSGGAPNATISSGRLINLSHQLQVVFRVITRDMDSASRLRPDNLN